MLDVKDVMKLGEKASPFSFVSEMMSLYVADNTSACALLMFFFLFFLGLPLNS